MKYFPTNFKVFPTYAMILKRSKFFGHKKKQKKTDLKISILTKKSKFIVPGYMDLKKNQNSMYTGTWIWWKNKTPCTGWNLDFLAIFFQFVKKLLNFWNFVNIKVAKSKLNHLGFYCKLDFRKIRNWNPNWVLIDGTPCIY